MSSNVAARVHSTAFTPDFSSLLERAGFTIRGNRAGCPYCTGRSRLTVSVGEDVAYCYRCKWTRNLRTLSRELALPVAAETTEQRRARWRAGAFGEWLDICYRILLDRLRRLARDVEWAGIVLEYEPQSDIAWDTLAQVYSEEAGIFAALDVLCFEKAGRWLEQPVSRLELFRAFEEALANE